TLALARASRLRGDERSAARAADYAARATQAILVLLQDTVTESGMDPADPRAVRHTASPSTVLNRLAAAGLLVAAINELPAPQKALLDKSEQLCNFIRRQQQPDGSLCLTDDPNDRRAVADMNAVNQYPGMALYGLMRSQQHKPAPWKTEAARRALT